MQSKSKKNNDQERLIKKLREGLRLMRECPICKQEFDENKVFFLEEKDPAHLVHLTCPQCANSVLAIMMFTPIGMSTVGIVTDLDPMDVVQMRGNLPVSEDEVLDFHSLLQNFESKQLFV